MSYKIKFTLSLSLILTLILGLQQTISAQQYLDSTNYRIVDSTLDSGGGVSTGTNFDLLASLGNPTADARLTSTTYAIGSGFPNGIQANVPLLRCAEANTNSGSTVCLNFPNANGAQGECGTPGCYDRIKFEIDHQNNPIDALYLVSLLNTTTATQYYLQSDHTIATTYDIADYMTICAHEGKDIRSGSGCAILSDPLWDVDLQSTNIYGLTPGHTYEVRVRALNGDFTESMYSPAITETLEYPVLTMDLDIGTSSSVDNSAPYSVPFGTLELNTVKTATDRIWLDLNTNLVNGVNLYVRDQNSGLNDGASTLGSDSEDLDVDPDADGGYGLKIDTSTQTSLGPIQRGSTYNTLNTNQVGALTTSNALIFFTDTTGVNKGPIAGGRVSISVKALLKGSFTSTLSDRIIFSMIANP
jgi:hypothetical protein